MVEGGELVPGDGGVQLGVVEDDVRAFPAELEERPFQVGRGLPHDLLADFDGTGEADLVDPGMAGEGRPGVRSLAVNVIPGAWQEPGRLLETRALHPAEG